MCNINVAQWESTGKAATETLLSVSLPRVRSRQQETGMGASHPGVDVEHDFRDRHGTLGVDAETLHKYCGSRGGVGG